MRASRYATWRRKLRKTGVLLEPSVGGVADPDFAALLANPGFALRKPAKGAAISELRAAANGFMARAKGPKVAQVVSYEGPGAAGPIGLRAYRPNSVKRAPVVIFLHGGGFVMGDLDSHDAMCRELAVRSAATVIAVGYRLAPEHPFPAALDDAESVIAWVREQADALSIDKHRLAVVGDSAGGQLAVAVTLREIAAGRTIRHLGLLYPMLDPSQSSPSQREYGEGYMLTTSFIEWGWRSYRGARRSVSNPAEFDVFKAEFSGFPSTTMITAGCDPLRDEGEELWRVLRGAGTEAVLRRYEHAIHGFAGLPQVTDAAADALSFVGERLKKAFKSDGSVGGASGGKPKNGKTVKSR
jgi:acetyl esterase